MAGVSGPSVDLSVAQALFAARLMEDAVHHPGPWTFRWADVEVEATRTITSEGVIFTGVFPDVCYIERPSGSLELRCDGEVRALRSTAEIEHPGDIGFSVSWALLARHAQQVEAP